jgi:hypothetical protein
MNGSVTASESESLQFSDAHLFPNADSERAEQFSSLAIAIIFQTLTHIRCRLSPFINPRNPKPPKKRKITPYRLEEQELLFNPMRFSYH